MKKWILIMMMITGSLLSGCSMLGEVNETLDYANTTMSHLENLNSFAEEAPQMVQAAMTDSEMKEELEAQLVTIQQDIEEFISLTDIPEVAENIHQELVTKNEALLAEVNKVLDNGQLALDKLENSELLTTAQEVSSLMTQVEGLLE
ncbi:DUF6376 family protein [Mesobacillus maritimus]|uniref:DUF6376 family protein n=1 Tax=Mesobacillus maritimus TaxID=1643336 RepID=UPI00203E79A2|nr:DUF6376 family protein [Mesobacillus maritimus]MCM3585316.1 DUF6376 family protein [Mesobacillus maritimus]MCM3668197.1 DUF6376 family protein [Mesobacillus maritimus]